MRRLLGSLVAAAALTVALAAPAAAGGGVSPARLASAGWTCFNVPGLGVHCIPPSAQFGDPTLPILYFGSTSDPTSSTARLSGSELLLRADRYHGQPCVQEGIATWHDIGGYFACHHS